MIPAPRLLIGGTGSGCGKTTVTCALLQAYQNQGLEVAAFKCGPDYIDPMFHSRILGTRSRNLDAFLCGRDTVPQLLARSAGKDLSILEGVMGYYDGMGTTAENSTADIALLTGTPTVLTLSARGMSLSAAALLEGFLHFSENTIRGVILNGVPPHMTDYYAGIIEKNTGLPVFGALPRDERCTVGSRHLGLKTAGEIADLQGKMQLLAQHAREGMDLNRLLALAREAEPLLEERPNLPQVGTGVTIAVARDEAFCFDYADSLAVLEDMGAELRFFSPLHDTTLPPCDGLLLCGGYPELYAPQLSTNAALLRQIRDAIRGGLPTVAECGGFLLLHDHLDGAPMAGVCGGAAHMTSRLQPFGYIELTARRDNLLCKQGETLRAHEFHYAASTDPGADFRAQKPNSARGWDCIHAGATYFLGYPHIHFAGNEWAAARFLTVCRKETNT